MPRPPEGNRQTALVTHPIDRDVHHRMNHLGQHGPLLRQSIEDSFAEMSMAREAPEGLVAQNEAGEPAPASGAEG